MSSATWRMGVRGESTVRAGAAPRAGWGNAGESARALRAGLAMGGDGLAARGLVGVLIMFDRDEAGKKCLRPGKFSTPRHAKKPLCKKYKSFADFYHRGRTLSMV